MINVLSDKLLRFMRNNFKNYNVELNEVYKYGIEITISSFLNFFLIFILSLLSGDLINGLIFLIIFITVRKYCGGYHATTYFRCNLIFSLSFIITVISSMLLGHLSEALLYIEILMVALGIIPVILFAPVKNKYKQIDYSGMKKYKYISIFLYVACSAAGFILYFLDVIYHSMIFVSLHFVQAVRGGHKLEKTQDCLTVILRRFTAD